MLKVVVKELRHAFAFRARLSQPSENHPNVETGKGVLRSEVVLQVQGLPHAAVLAVVQGHLQEGVGSCVGGVDMGVVSLGEVIAWGEGVGHWSYSGAHLE